MALTPIRLVKPVKKLRKVLTTLDSNSAPEQIHDLRTNARRFDAVFKALDLEAEGIPKSVFKELGRLRKRAGKIRDMDVLTEFAAAIRPKEEAECHVRLLEHLGARRQKQAGKLHAEAKHLRRKLCKALGQVSSRIKGLFRGKESGAADRVVANAAAAAIRLSVQLTAPPRLNKTNLHPYRLKVKELQNILLMAEAPSRPRFVEDLGAVKDAIGEWHDWEELVGIASKLLDHDGNCLLLAELKRVAETKYSHGLALAHELRNTYLQSARPKRKNGTLAGVSRAAVWEAIARLAG